MESMSREKPPPPRRLRMKRESRLQAAKKWIRDYQGKCVIKGYQKWFGVDAQCAIKELLNLGMPLKSDRIAQLECSAEEKAKQRKLKKERQIGMKKSVIWPPLEQDKNLAFIAGYTSNGFPYGISWEEWESLAHED